MKKLRIARCPGDDCLQRITCMHYRAEEIDTSLPEINPLARMSMKVHGCKDYLRLFPGFVLRSWEKLRNAQTSGGTP